MTTESGNSNALVFKLFLPSFGFRTVVDEFVEGAVVILRVAAGADLHDFKAEGADSVEHGVERESFVNGVEDANGNLPQISVRTGFGRF